MMVAPSTVLNNETVNYMPKDTAIFFAAQKRHPVSCYSKLKLCMFHGELYLRSQMDCKPCYLEIRFYETNTQEMQNCASRKGPCVEVKVGSNKR